MVTLGNVATACMTRVKGSGLLNYILNWGGYLKRLLHGEDLSQG